MIRATFPFRATLSSRPARRFSGALLSLAPLAEALRTAPVVGTEAGDDAIRGPRPDRSWWPCRSRSASSSRRGRPRRAEFSPAPRRRSGIPGRSRALVPARPSGLAVRNARGLQRVQPPLPEGAGEVCPGHGGRLGEPSPLRPHSQLGRTLPVVAGSRREQRSDGRLSGGLAGFLRGCRRPARSGQNFEESDDTDGQPVVIVDESLARLTWPNQSAVGKRLGVDPQSSGHPTNGRPSSASSATSAIAA